MSIITNVDSNSLQLSECVDDLPINSDEKLNFEVRVCCLFLSDVQDRAFLKQSEAYVTILFGLYSSPNIGGQSDYQQVKIHKIHSFNYSRLIKSCC